MTFSVEAVAEVKARLQERMDQRKLERDIREAVIMVQRHNRLESIPDGQWEPAEKARRRESV